MGDWADLEEFWEEERELAEAMGYTKARNNYLDALEKLSEREDDEASNGT